MTTYDDIWTEFLAINKTDSINLPDSDEKIYHIIHSAIRHFNARLGESLRFDDELEQVDQELSDWRLILLAHYIRLSFYENQLTDLSSTWSPFQKDIGIKNYQEQSRNLKELISNEESKIEKIIVKNYTGDLEGW